MAPATRRERRASGALPAFVPAAFALAALAAGCAEFAVMPGYGPRQLAKRDWPGPDLGMILGTMDVTWYSTKNNAATGLSFVFISVGPDSEYQDAGLDHRFRIAPEFRIGPSFGVMRGRIRTFVNPGIVGGFYTRRSKLAAESWDDVEGDTESGLGFYTTFGAVLNLGPVAVSAGYSIGKNTVEFPSGEMNAAGSQFTFLIGRRAVP